MIYLSDRDKVFRVLHKETLKSGRFIDYNELSRLSGIRKENLHGCISRLHKMNGVKTERKIEHQHTQIRLVKYDNNAYNYAL